MRPSMNRVSARLCRAVRVASLALVALLTLPLLPVGELFAPAPQSSRMAAAAAIPVPPGPPVTAPPLTGRAGPSLAVLVRVAPDPVIVGQPTRVTVTVINDGSLPANNLAVTLAAPPGVLPQPGPGYTAGATGWNWSQSQLAPRRDTTFTATLVVASLPPSQALLLKPSVIARELSQPVTKTGGAVVVVPPAMAETSRPVAARALARVESGDGRLAVAFPATATAQDLTVTYRTARAPGEPRPQVSPPGGRGFGTFHLTATDAQGQAVSKFAAPLTLTLRYTPEQIEALRVNPATLAFFWYDSAAVRGPNAMGRWKQLPTTVDPAARTVTTTVDHFTPFTVIDTESTEAIVANFRPTLQGFQVAPFTGAASYTMPIAVPAGPGGLAPDLTLGYTSSQTDGTVGESRGRSSGWVGKGWSLDPGAISVDLYNSDKSKTNPYEYTLVLGGKSYRLFGEAQDGIDPRTNHDPSKRNWRTADESFMKITVTGNGDSTYLPNGEVRDSEEGRRNSRGFIYLQPKPGEAGAQPRHKWSVWTKDGTRYDFEEDLWMGFDDCLPDYGADGGYYEAFAYSTKLTKVTDTHGNTITYTWKRRSDQPPPLNNIPGMDACGYMKGTADEDAWLQEVTWGKNTNKPDPDRFRVKFWTSDDSDGTAGQPARDYDNDWDNFERQPGGSEGQALRQYGYSPHVVVQLNYIDVQSKGQGADYQLVSRYRLDYLDKLDPGVMLSDYSSDTNAPETSAKKLTLARVTRFGNDGAAHPGIGMNDGSLLPYTQFSYGTDRGTDYYPNGDWNRLREATRKAETAEFGIVEHGKVRFDYETVGRVVDDPNSFGGFYAGDADYKPRFRNYRRVKNRVVWDGRGPDATWGYQYGFPRLNAHDTKVKSAAEIYYTENDSDADHGEDDLAVPKYREFRGHEWTEESDPNGRKTRRWFYQGDLRDRGGPDCTLPGSGTAQATIEADSCFAQYRINGILKGQEYKVEVRDRDGNLQEVTERFFPTTLGDLLNRFGSITYTGVWYAWAAVRRVEATAYESGAAGPKRTTTNAYDTGPQGGTQRGNVTATEERFGDQGGTLLRRTETSYAVNDGGDTYIVDRPTEVVLRDAGGIIGRKRLAYDDMGSGVGARGRLTRESGFTNAAAATGRADTGYEYDDWGNRTAVTTYRDYDGMGGRTTRTRYDDVMHVYPVRRDQPAVNGIVLTTRAEYDWRMGTTTKVIDANDQETTATYDKFGRPTEVKKPLSGSNPTMRVIYRDGANPANYTIERFDATGNRPSTTFYDGRGRVIQVKEESRDGEQNIVTDTRYDGVDNPVQVSQPRYVDEMGAAFFGYTPPAPGDLFRATKTEYDSLARAKSVTAPDTNVRTQTNYRITSEGREVEVIDANGHKTRQITDAFGRMTRVIEVFDAPTGDKTTEYTYNARDELLKTKDAKGNETAYTRDDLGRVTQTRDPDLGITNATHDAAGNLRTTVDANMKTIERGYDDLDRMRSQTYDGQMATFTYDGATATFGKGRLTGTTSPHSMSSMQTEYDARGRTRRANWTIQGVTASFEYGYDNADLKTSTRHPDGELVETTYDAAQRATKLQGANGGQLYARDATYTAPGKRTGLTMGNGVAETWSYSDALQRLVKHEIGAGGNLFKREYRHDNAGNVKTITNAVANETQAFDYDARDRLTRGCAATGVDLMRTCAAGPFSYDETTSYDEIGNLLTKGGATYTYPMSGPMSTRPHAVTAAGGSSYSYDAVGNTLMGGGRSFTWNSQNRPTAITGGGGGGGTATPTAMPTATATATATNTPVATSTGTPVATATSTTGPTPTPELCGPANVPGTPSYIFNRGGATVAGAPGNTNSRVSTGGTPNPALAVRRGCGPLGPAGASVAQAQAAGASEAYTYDAEGERVSRTHGGITTLYFGGVWEVDKESGTTRAYYQLGGTTVAQRERAGGMGSGTPFWLHGDHLGGATLTTTTSGAKQNGQEYGPWGEQRSGDLPETTIDFTGQRRDDTGLLYYGARYYDPVLGRFLSADPIGVRKGNPQSLNRYAYVLNNPVNTTDPTGHLPYPGGQYPQPGYATPYGGYGYQGYGENSRLSLGGFGALVGGPRPDPSTITGVGISYSDYQLNYVPGNAFAHDAVVIDFIRNRRGQGWLGNVFFYTGDRGGFTSYDVDLFNYITGEILEVKPFGEAGEGLNKIRELEQTRQMSPPLTQQLINKGGVPIPNAESQGYIADPSRYVQGRAYTLTSIVDYNSTQVGSGVVTYRTKDRPADQPDPVPYIVGAGATAGATYAGYRIGRVVCGAGGCRVYP